MNSQRRIEQKVYKRRSQWDAWKKRQNVERVGNKRIKTASQFERIVIPTIFSLQENVNEVLAFINICRNKVSHRSAEMIFFDFENVAEISSGAVTILLSIIKDFTARKVRVEGNYPKDSKAKEFLMQSGFLRYLRTSVKGSISNPDNAILVKGLSTVEPDKTAPLIHKAMHTVFGDEQRNKKIQGMLVEMMSNSVNHAFNGSGRTKSPFSNSWYFSVNHIKENNIVKFCFVDNGKGILRTIKLRFFERLKKVVNVTDDDLIVKAFNGEFGSRTELPQRGKGLKMIRKIFDDKYIEKLVVITNNVYFDFSNMKMVLLEYNFKGTFYFWELSKSCKYDKYQDCH